MEVRGKNKESESDSLGREGSRADFNGRSGRKNYWDGLVRKEKGNGRKEDQGPVEHSWLSQVLGLKDRLSQLDLNLLPEREKRNLSSSLKIRPEGDSDLVLNKVDDQFILVDSRMDICYVEHAFHKKGKGKEGKERVEVKCNQFRKKK
ncbi:hypothetical protein Q3G72_018083 [Acer saccharum]|nr:hypothetical protein Q3G72_018083 [Acer saccharum]